MELVVHVLVGIVLRADDLFLSRTDLPSMVEPLPVRTESPFGIPGKTDVSDYLRYI